MAPMFEASWSSAALRHIERRHGIELEEILRVLEDPDNDFRRARGDHYRVIGTGHGRILTLILEDAGRPRLALVTARPANRAEKRLYRRRKR